MKKKVRELRGLIYSLYDTEAEFASKIGWERQRLSKITNGTKEPDVNELNILSKALGKTIDDMAQIFLHHKSPNRRRYTELK